MRELLFQQAANHTLPSSAQYKQLQKKNVNSIQFIPALKYTPLSKLPTHATFPLPSPKYVTNSPKNTPNVYAIPSTIILHMNDANTITHPYLQNDTIYNVKIDLKIIQIKLWMNSFGFHFSNHKIITNHTKVLLRFKLK